MKNDPKYVNSQDDDADYDIVYVAGMKYRMPKHKPTPEEAAEDAWATGFGNGVPASNRVFRGDIDYDADR